MPETQNDPSAAASPETPEAGALFQLLLSGKGNPRQVYTAMREVESMAGQGVVAQLTALIRTTAAEQTTQFQAAIAERTAPLQAAIAELAAQLQTTNARLDSVEKQLGRIWTFLFLLLGTLVGTLTTLLTTLLLRG